MRGIKMKKKIMAVLFGIAVLVCILTGGILLAKDSGETGTMEKHENQRQNLIAIGFSQVGAESDWRTANSVSVKQTFTVNKGYDLIFDDAKQIQTNQIRAIRSFIQQDVDYIVFSPVVEDGWDTVLEEAKMAQIPVIVIDRRVKVKDEELYTAWVGSDFYIQGQKACAALNAWLTNRDMQNVNIVNIQGTLGATAQIERTRALEEAAETYGWNILAQESGEYTEAKAYEVMSEMLKEYVDIQVVYCDNDNEAFGAIEAIEDAGRTVGGEDGDIQVVAFDATRSGLEYVMNEKILIDMECNPLQGPRVEELIKQLQLGQKPEKQTFMEEQIFTWDYNISRINVNGQEYPVETLTQDIIDSREY